MNRPAGDRVMMAPRHEIDYLVLIAVILLLVVASYLAS